uniref:Rubicon Homology domain-containing protein n=1 Tax=Plectus sambesii TaxID=2011161 RepID=A0A914X450_9BILA
MIAVSARKRTGSSGIVVEMEDIPEDDIPMGVSALEYEGLENDSFPPPSPSAYAKSPLCLPGRHTPKGAFSEDEDASSVYSHPSMMDGKFQEAMRYPRARAGSQTSTSTPNPTTDEREGFSDSGIASDMGQVVVHRHSRSATRSSPSGSFSSQPPPPSITVSDFGCQTVTESGAQTDVCDLTLSTAVGTSNDDIIDDVSDDQHVFLNAQTTLNQDDDGVEEDGERSQLIAPPTPFGELDDTFVTAREKLDSVDQSPADSPVGKDNTETLNDSAPEENMGAAESIPIKFTRSLELNDGEPKSLGDELMIAALNDSIFNQSGNSLFGKGWGSREVIEEDRIRFSSLNATTDDPADTTSDSTPENFDAVLRNALSYRLGLVDSPAPETKVRNRLDSGRFADTVNDRSETPIEVGRASIDENADEAALAAARTVLPPDAGVSNRRLTSINLDEYVVIDSSQVSGMDECGISSDRLPLLTRIAPEEGLDLQNYQCPSCRRSIGLIYGPWKTCSFDGKYYCPDCQRKDEMIVPARMIHSWDLSLKPVSRPSKSFVDHVADRPLIRLDQVNPTLYEAIPEMATVHMLREKLSLVAMYLLTCKESVADDLRRRVWPKEYLYNDIHLFSVNDLINASTGVLEKHLLSVIAYAMKHVEQCRLCVQKGFICEICTHKQIIYPFQVETTFRCTKCFSVYHQGCIKNRPCPKCLRKEQ